MRPTELAWWGPLSTDATLARINEPSAGAPGGAQAAAGGARQRPNVAATEAVADADSLMIGVVRPVAAGEELLLSYGENYDRSGYGAP